MIDNKIYILQKDLPGIKAGTVFIQHPKAVNRFYPQDCYENGELIEDRPQGLAIYGFLRRDVQDINWFLPASKEEIEIIKAKELLRKQGYIFDSVLVRRALTDGKYTDQDIEHAWNSGWDAFKLMLDKDSDTRMEKYMDGAYDYLKSLNK